MTITNDQQHKLFSHFDYQYELKKIWDDKKLANNTINHKLSYKNENQQSASDRFHLVKVKPNNKVASCDCAGSKVGIINLDPSAHLPGCWIRKKIRSKQFAVNTSVVPTDYDGGYTLGVATN
jgi:hypothetical protein